MMNKVFYLELRLMMMFKMLVKKMMMMVVILMMNKISLEPWVFEAIIIYVL